MTGGKPSCCVNGFSPPLLCFGSAAQRNAFPFRHAGRGDAGGSDGPVPRGEGGGCSGEDGVMQSLRLRVWAFCLPDTVMGLCYGSLWAKNGFRLIRRPPQKKENKVWDSWLGLHVKE